MFKSNVKDVWWTEIKNGTKSVEGRLNKGKFAEFKKGDIVIWINSENKKKCKTKIIRISKYKTFYEYLINEGLRNTLPIKKITSIAKGVNIYYKYYTKSDEKKYGILAIELQII